ncbi:3-dehydroquinate dehydratase-1 [Conyzicola lurida]|uniref:3-dehydroquinate dehydratase n=1 Tax=Conyzicola lurida TaxID=1172621 RepID=A0A841AL36_9MICO|nr:3-dehydroquinate dehydratase-1 [Conyzicola lurida]
MADSPRPLAAVALRDVVLGEGVPKICVPIMGPDVAALRSATLALPVADLDLVELRADYLDDLGDAPAAIDAVRSALPADVPLLFTFRTLAEGGERELPVADYESLLLRAIESGLVDAVDVEQFTPRDSLEHIVAAAHTAGVPVVMSSHDFDATPERDEIVDRLRAQQDLGADVVKIAVMPHRARDVLMLLDATEEFRSNHARVPAITMAMGSLGVVSRLAGETFGSCLTFGSAGAASAPGQVEVGQLRAILALVHGSE